MAFSEKTIDTKVQREEQLEALQQDKGKEAALAEAAALEAAFEEDDSPIKSKACCRQFDLKVDVTERTPNTNMGEQSLGWLWLRW